MQVRNTFWILIGLAACVAQPAWADCSVRTTGHENASMSQPSYASEDRTVILQVQLSKSGRVRGAVVVSGPGVLRPAAITAVRARTYKVIHWSADLKRLRLAVTFDKDNSTVTDISQVVYVINQTPPLGDVRQVILATGSPGCVQAPTVVRASQGVMQSRLVRRVEPVYPPKAREQHVQGTVVLRLLIDQQGNVVKAEKISGHDALVPAAVDAAKQWKYQPFILNGEPIAVDTTIDMKFAL